MEPGRVSSVIVIALTKEAQDPTDPGACWTTRGALRVDGRDEGVAVVSGQSRTLALPREFPPPTAFATLRSDTFPLAHLLERIASGINGIFRDSSRGALFDERMSLRDALGSGRGTRHLLSPPAGGDVARLSARSPRLDRLTASGRRAGRRSAVATAGAGVAGGQNQGRVVHATEPRIRAVGVCVPRLAYVLNGMRRSNSRQSRARRCMDALQKSLAGHTGVRRPSMRTPAALEDVCTLRSHFVPYVSKDAGNDLSTRSCMRCSCSNTIGSHSELMELDRLRRSKSQYKSLVEASASRSGRATTSSSSRSSAAVQHARSTGTRHAS